MTREELLEVAAELKITEDEAGEPEWQSYLNDTQLAEAIERMRPGTFIGRRVSGGDGEHHDTGTCDSFGDGMVVVRWDSLVVTPCPISELRMI